MKTRCPQCHTVFRIIDAQLQAAGGKVRCGQCSTVFDARNHLEATPPKTEVAPATPQYPLEGMEPTATEQVPPSAPEAPRAAAEPEPEASVAASSEVPEVLAEDWHQIHKPARPRHGAAWMIAAAFLALLLAAQLLYAQRHPLARQPHLAQWVHGACDALAPLLDCRLPTPTQVQRVRILSYQIQEHPQYANALRIESSLVNRDAEAVTFPVLQVTLTNIQGRTTAVRRFKPSEYLVEGTMIDKGMIPDRPYAISLDVYKPEENSPGYELQLL